MRRPEEPGPQGYPLLADISDYTAFLTDTELEQMRCSGWGLSFSHRYAVATRAYNLNRYG